MQSVSVLKRFCRRLTIANGYETLVSGRCKGDQCDNKTVPRQKLSRLTLLSLLRRSKQRAAT